MPREPLASTSAAVSIHCCDRTASRLRATANARSRRLEPMSERIPDASQPLWAEAEYLFQTAVVRGRLEILERFDA